MPLYSVYFSPASAKSINTGFSAIAGSIDTHKRHISVWNLTSSTVAIAFGASAPTSTTFERIIVPSGGTTTKDSESGISFARPNDSIYLAQPDSSTTNIASGTLIMELW